MHFEGRENSISFYLSTKIVIEFVYLSEQNTENHTKPCILFITGAYFMSQKCLLKGSSSLRSSDAYDADANLRIS